MINTSNTIMLLAATVGAVMFWQPFTKGDTSPQKVYDAHAFDIDEGLERIEEVAVPEDLKTYAGLRVVECDVIDSVYPTHALLFDHGGFIIEFTGNIKCTSDEGAYLIPARVGVEVDENGNHVNSNWVLTGSILQNVIHP